MTHDPARFASQLSAKLAATSRHVCLLLGAGSSCACGLPDVSALQKKVIEALAPDQKEQFLLQLTDQNLEGALSRLRRIAALVREGQTLDDLSAADALALDAAVCKAIVKELDLKAANLSPMRLLAAWVARSAYRMPVEIFTTNYDLLIEAALEASKVPYFDGFIGSLKAGFHIDLVEGGHGAQQVPAFFTRLWKLHGSVNWAWNNGAQIVRLGAPVSDGAIAAIYPSDAKYEESRRVPFVVLQDRLRRALNEPETLILISGYSFSDEHLNELIFDAAGRHERSEFVATCYSVIPDAVSARALVTPNLQVVAPTEAILGGVRAKWEVPTATVDGVWSDKFLLSDFAYLARYLARSSSRPEDIEKLVEHLNEKPGGHG